MNRSPEQMNFFGESEQSPADSQNISNNKRRNKSVKGEKRELIFNSEDKRVGAGEVEDRGWEQPDPADKYRGPDADYRPTK
jgi:hypothetical protein